MHFTALAHLHTACPGASCPAAGEVPNLFAKDELLAIMEAVTPRAKRAGRPLTPASLYAFFVAQCRANLHLVLAMSPVGAAFRER
jgi:dynein heavy chain